MHLIPRDVSSFHSPEEETTKRANHNAIRSWHSIETEGLQALARRALVVKHARNNAETGGKNHVSFAKAAVSEERDEQFEERAAIYEFDAGMNRAEAEAEAKAKAKGDMQ